MSVTIFRLSKTADTFLSLSHAVSGSWQSLLCPLCLTVSPGWAISKELKLYLEEFEILPVGLVPELSKGFHSQVLPVSFSVICISQPTLERIPLLFMFLKIIIISVCMFVYDVWIWAHIVLCFSEARKLFKNMFSPSTICKFWDWTQVSKLV